MASSVQQIGTIEEKIITETELVSIIMPNYNGAKFLKETIDSVVNQTYKNWELLFVDDCSTDNSVDLVAQYKDPRIRIFKNKTNSGAATSRNIALREAAGKWIAFLDSDDLWEENKLKKQIQFMHDHDYHFSYTSYVHINEESEPLNVKVTGPKKIMKRKMFCYNYVGCLTVMYDAELVGLIQVEPTLKSRNDYAIWLKACKLCDCYYLDDTLSKYRVRNNSLTHSGLKPLIKNQYRLYRLGEKMGVIRSVYHVVVNMFFGTLKKIVYVKRI